MHFKVVQQRGLDSSPSRTTSMTCSEGCSSLLTQRLLLNDQDHAVASVEKCAGHTARSSRDKGTQSVCTESSEWWGSFMVNDEPDVCDVLHVLVSGVMGLWFWDRLIYHYSNYSVIFGYLN